MSNYHNFTVRFSKNKSILDMLTTLLVIIVLLVTGVQIVVNRENPVLMFIIFGPIVLCSIISNVMIKLYYVKVKGKSINVRTYLGRKYSFMIFDINRVEWTIRENNRMYYEKITLRMKDYKSISIDNTMEGFNKMTKYILENVEPEKIFKRETEW